MRPSKHVILFATLLVFTASFPESVIVDTRNGKVSGLVLRTLLRNVEYKGFIEIPYAAPPVGELRFLAPQPVQPWDDILSTTKEKPACFQFNNNVKKGQPLGFYGSEDCLYLDVFTPNVDHPKNPVIVFIYNENFRNSYNKTKDYGPDFFMEEGIVIVTIAHRLSILGFLSLEDDDIPGNAGLRDIVAGLEWIQNNIASFGGDPTKVTLMGTRGGAASVDLLINSNVNGLFHSAILQSGTSQSSMYLQNNARERAAKLAELLGKESRISKQLIKDLRELPPEKLYTKEWDVLTKDYFKAEQKSLLAFGPVFEENSIGLLTENPEDKYKQIDLPIMIGFNSREGLEPSLQYLIEPRYLSFVEKEFPLLMPRRLKFKFEPLEDAYSEAVKDVKRFYFSKGKVDFRKATEYITYIGDVITGYAMDYTTKLYANSSSAPVFYFHFDYFSDLSENKNNLLKLSNVEDGTWGAASGDELCYLFKCPDLIEMYLKQGRNDEKFEIQTKLVRLWANFAKYGNPTPDEDISLDGLKWEPYNIKTKKYLHIDKHFQIKEHLNSRRYNFWENFIEKWSKQADNGVVKSLKKDEL